MAAKDRVRAAVVGTGGIARSHLAAFRAHGDQVDVVAAVDVDAARLREFCADAGTATPYDDLEHMLRERRPDLVAICTPPSLHADQVVTVLRHGAWAWCEKPPCLSLAEYDRIVAAERAGGPYAAIVFQHRFGSAAEHLRTLLRTGELGRPLVAHCQTTWYRDDAYYAVPWRGRWETEGGGPTMGHGIHQMDLMLHLLGDWVEVRAMVGRLVHDVATEDVSTALVRFASGAMATVVNSVLSADQVSRIRLDCTDATVELTHLYGYRNEDWVYTPAPHVTDERRVSRWRSPAEDVASSHAAQLRGLLAALREGARPACSGPDGRRVLELVAALYKSALTGLPVRAGEIGAEDPFYAAMHGGMAGAQPGARPGTPGEPLGTGAAAAGGRVPAGGNGASIDGAHGE
ncbi:Gfo/Idh/MocA family protein [Gandjariella thermophila]|uniref:Oxidoreductase n=1 Tax=Gandjariella thermophila TaxID=1931992 RepID=A0A4D4JA85_9PSEU|nr:Gfo/Idh/MocA family oxidoreductase [Gandjariella thermophila]GDY31588.1 oxidoreductase [Gandjariella thermophila]